MNHEYLIRSNEMLQDCIQQDRTANTGNKKITLETCFRRSFPYMVSRYLTVLRKLEYACYRRDHANNRIVSLIRAQKVKLLDRRKNVLGLRLGAEIPINRVKPGVRIAHPNVILNGYVGEGCVFHGNNVLGNKKTGDKNAIPTLGNHVDVGVGAIIIGKVEIADDCVIGAGAVVTRSFTVPGTVIVGVPAKELKN